MNKKETHRILVTGATGFVGGCLCACAVKSGMYVHAAVRRNGEALVGVDRIAVGEINGTTDWSEALIGVNVVLHLASRVHVMKETSPNPESEFRQINVEGTENLARQAARAGVKRFVYVSSIKVNGEGTCGEQSYTEADTTAPQDPYGVSKWEAEQALHRVARETGLEVVIVRPPLVYGPGVKGNFISLMRAVAKGIPLPLAGARNARSLVYVGNLVDALILCAKHPAAAGQTYLVSDGVPVSTAVLVEKMATALGCRNRSFYASPIVLRAAANLLGRSAQMERLFGSLQVDDNKIRRELGWEPKFTLEQGLAETAKWFRENEAVVARRL